jgi:hypothetical protein
MDRLRRATKFLNRDCWSSSRYSSLSPVCLVRRAKSLKGTGHKQIIEQLRQSGDTLMVAWDCETHIHFPRSHTLFLLASSSALSVGRETKHMNSTAQMHGNEKCVSTQRYSSRQRDVVVPLAPFSFPALYPSSTVLCFPSVKATGCYLYACKYLSILLLMKTNKFLSIILALSFGSDSQTCVGPVTQRARRSW